MRHSKRSSERDRKRWRSEIEASDCDDQAAQAQSSPAREDERQAGASRAGSHSESEPSGGDESDCEGALYSLAMPELARWCRVQLRNASESEEARAIRSLLHGSEGPPSQMLHSLSATPLGRRFLTSCGEEYSRRLTKAAGRRERSRLLAALASVSEAMGQPALAADYTRGALSLLLTNLPTSVLDETRWGDGGGALLPPSVRAAVGTLIRPRSVCAALLSELVRLHRQLCANQARAAYLRRAPSLPDGATLEISRVEGISVRSFFQEYAMRRE
ncbi:MAG: hypothetical protein SGPRY_000032 [Prymnesium sp.]